jgi:predicted ATP-grasp superfamily ATP-dependent carboligase
MSDPADGPRSTVLIVGASTRSAAQSAIRAGLSPICADLFADLDLRACAQVLEVPDYPQGLVAAAAGACECPWMYTGGLENHAGLIARISQSRLLWGNGTEVLRRVRDPWQIRDGLVDSGLPALCVWPREAAPPPADGTWMLRPRRGAAGRGIRVWEDPSSNCATLREAHYFQERCDGDPVSALYLAAPPQTYILAVTRQLIGLEAVHAPPFTWCGTITPIRLPEGIITTMHQVGAILALRTGLRGLFGCDFLVEDGQAWLTEVNPRYPASTELVEHVLQEPLLDWHRRVFEGAAAFEVPPSFVVPPPFVVPPSGGFRNAPPEGGTTSVGKIVLYAHRDIVAPDATRFVTCPSPWLGSTAPRDDGLPSVADIPAPGQAIARGHPICTLFARAPSESECLAELLRSAAQFERSIR